MIIVVVLGSTFAAHHLINHICDATTRILLLYLGPLLHDSILKLNSQLAHAKLRPVIFLARAHIVVEDVVEGDGNV